MDAISDTDQADLGLMALHNRDAGGVKLSLILTRVIVPIIDIIDLSHLIKNIIKDVSIFRGALLLKTLFETLWVFKAL